MLTPRVVAKNIKTNLKCLLSEEKGPVFLITSYFLVKFGLSVAHPRGEDSNGSPLSLIAFTVLFITVFAAPLVLRALCLLIGGIEKKLPCFAGKWMPLNNCAFENPWKEVVQQKKSILICVVFVIISYIFDGDISSVIQYLGKGQACWPLLGSNPRRDENIVLNIVKSYSWHGVFQNYQPLPILGGLILYGSELGEVRLLLPMLIGTYTLSQIFLPPENSLIKRILFASIAGVILGGVTSGTLKILFHRYRPNAYGDPYMWKGPGLTTVNHLSFSKLDLSFPAGHTTVTTAVATCWYQLTATCNFKNMFISNCVQFALLMCFYIHPLVVLVSRVSDCCHWTSDASFGVSTLIMVG